MLVCRLSSPVSSDGPAATTAFVKELSGSAVACVVTATRWLRRLEGNIEGPALAVRLRVCASARFVQGSDRLTRPVRKPASQQR